MYKVKLDGELIELQILDVTGSRLIRNTFDEFYAVVEGIVIVYDITEAASFGGARFYPSSLPRSSAIDIHLWMRDLEKYTFLQKVVVANKSDREEQRVRGDSTRRLLLVLHVTHARARRRRCLPGAGRSWPASTTCCTWRRAARRTPTSTPCLSRSCAASRPCPSRRQSRPPSPRPMPPMCRRRRWHVMTSRTTRPVRRRENVAV